MDLSQEDLDALLGAYAIDAIDADERDELDALVRRDPLLAEEVRRLQEVAVGLVGAIPDQPAPPALRDGVLGRATRARPPGRHLANPLGPDLPAAELWLRQFGELDALLDDLLDAGPAGWRAVTSFQRSVHELLAHLGAVLDLFAADLGAGRFEVAEGTAIGHWDLTEPRIAEMTALPPAATVERLRATAAAITAALGALTDDQLNRVPVDGGVLTVIDRTRQQCFELWMHTDDIRLATGRPVVDPDPERICALSDLSARFIGLGMLVSGVSHGERWGRLVLTGPGGGTWRTQLGVADERAGDPDAARSVAPDGGDEVTVITDAVDYCRYVGNLLSLAELEYEVEGDAALAVDLLVGAQAFAE